MSPETLADHAATMTPEAAAILRRPFDPETIGKRPQPVNRADTNKGQCRPGSPYTADGVVCGGYHARSVHLDYVGHAATTDRLLIADPLWNWEPVAWGPDGLPLFDGNRNLWIRLTVRGVTRLGVGDGASVKEVIGDAIRNAAMRFGVALDLWARGEQLEQAHGPSTPPAPAVRVGALDRLLTAPGESVDNLGNTPVDERDSLANPLGPSGPVGQPTGQDGRAPNHPPVPDDESRHERGGNDGPESIPHDRHPTETGEALTSSQRAAIFAAFGDAGWVTDARSPEGRQRRLDYMTQVLQRTVESTSDLTTREASTVLDALREDARNYPEETP